MDKQLLPCRLGKYLVKNHEVLVEKSGEFGVLKLKRLEGQAGVKVHEAS